VLADSLDRLRAKVAKVESSTRARARGMLTRRREEREEAEVGRAAAKSFIRQSMTQTGGCRTGNSDLDRASRYNEFVVDTRTPAQRSRIMASVGQRNTGPEWVVRRLLHAHGFRYRLHDKKLPGKPDIVFPARQKAIFVHGCFWHGHECAKGRSPKSRQEYWLPKLQTNRERDGRALSELRELGWEALVVWQCETKDPNALREKLWVFLQNGPKKRSTMD
jgi:DNA mismatch endonuclease (patch repair protein)